MRTRHLLSLRHGELMVTNPLTELEQPLTEALALQGQSTALCLVAESEFVLDKLKAYDPRNSGQRKLLALYGMLIPVEHQMIIGTMEHFIRFAHRAGLLPPGWKAHGTALEQVAQLNDALAIDSKTDALAHAAIKEQSRAVASWNEAAALWNARNQLFQTAAYISAWGRLLTAGWNTPLLDCSTVDSGVAYEESLILDASATQGKEFRLIFTRAGSPEQFNASLAPLATARAPRRQRKITRTVPIDVYAAAVS